jgi:hydrogenase expression/formation protein HypE
MNSCPLPISQYQEILLGHGSGGRLTSDLLHQVFLPSLGNEFLNRQEDQAILPVPGDVRGSMLAFTTDSFVIQPIFFPGGDIGKLAVCGTINDLVVGGARPLYLSAAFIIEEGLPIQDLRRIVASMRAACDEAGVSLVAGDTKVVDRGKGDKIFITTSGVGMISNGPTERTLSISNARPGDQILVSGTIGDHGIAIMSLREGIEFETVLESDCASLGGLVEALLDVCPEVRCMRDPTRGGVGGVLHELADASNVGVKIVERSLPIRPEVRAACEILGLDPLYVANEGKLIAIVPPEKAENALAAMKRHPLGRNAARIGEVVSDHNKMVTIKSLIGGERVITLLAGEQLPRIC